jgi:PAS domain S-box-containing protein
MTDVVSNSTRRDVEPSDSLVRRGQRLAVRSLWLYALALVLWLAGHWRESKLVEDVCSWAPVPADVVALALIAMLLRAEVTHGVRRWGWGLLFLSVAIDLVATLMWTHIGPTTPYLLRMVGDMLYQLYYPLLTGAFALFFLSCGGSFRRPQLWLDALTVMLSMLAVLWATVYESPLAAGADHSMGFNTKLSYMLGISVTTTMTVLLLMQIRDWRTEQAVLRLVGAAVVGLFADVTWLGTNAGGSAALDLGYTVGDRIFNTGEVVFCAFVAGAAAAEQRRPLIPRTATNPPGNQYSFWPTLAFLLAIALLVGSEATQRGFDFRILVALVLFGAVLLVVRQQGVRYELRRLNRALAARDGEARLTELVRSSADLIAVVNTQRALAFVSPAAERMLGVPAADLRSTPASRLLGAQNETEVGEFLDGLFTVPAKATELETRITTPAGEVRAVHVVGRNELASPRIGGIVLTIRDVTEQLRVAEEIALRRIELTHLSRVSTRSELSVSIGHEINQPLQSILSNAQAALLFLAKESPDLDEIREILRDIVLDSRRAGEIMRKLRALLYKDESPFESLDLNEVVQSVCWLLHSELLIAGVAVQIKLAPDLPSIKGQRIQLQQVLLNLIINGCEAMTSVSRGNRELLLTTQMNDDKSVVVCIKDSGPGIPPDDLERVFDAFFTTKDNGMGLGLSVSRLIISSHGGRLWAATSHTGPGASISFTLPPELNDLGTAC